MGAMAVYISNKLLESFLGMEHLLTGFALLIRSQVCKGNGDASIEICQLAHALGYDVVFVFCCGKHCGVWPKLLACAPEFCFAHHLDRIEWLALFIFLLIYLTITEHLG